MRLKIVFAFSTEKGTLWWRPARFLKRSFRGLGFRVVYYGNLDLRFEGLGVQG